MLMQRMGIQPILCTWVSLPPLLLFSKKTADAQCELGLRITSMQTSCYSCKKRTLPIEFFLNWCFTSSKIAFCGKNKYTHQCIDEYLLTEVNVT